MPIILNGEKNKTKFSILKIELTGNRESEGDPAELEFLRTTSGLFEDVQ